MQTLQTLIEHAFEQRQTLSIDNASPELIAAVNEVLSCLDNGQYRVAEKINNEWVVHQWIKKAVLLSFRLYPNQVIDSGFCQFYDKVPLKYNNYTEEQFKQTGVRVVPHAMVRKGAYIAKNCVLMPSYVNVGAYIDEGVMVDTWATVGSCAQIGKNVHLSGGVGIGGVWSHYKPTPQLSRTIVLSVLAQKSSKE